MSVVVSVRLKKILKERNMTQKELSALTGIREATISSIARVSKRSIRYEYLVKIANALNITDINELMTFKKIN